MPLNLECQNKTKGMQSCFFIGVSMGGQRSFFCQVLLQIWLVAAVNSVESSSRKMINKFGSMKPIVREVGADSSNSNELGLLEWILED